jgi:hypothetical protein
LRLCPAFANAAFAHLWANYIQVREAMLFDDPTVASSLKQIGKLYEPYEFHKMPYSVDGDKFRSQ